MWERPPAEPHKQPGCPRGYLDYLTWQSRTIGLHPETVDGHTIVRRASYAQGRKLDAPGLFDPQMAAAHIELGLLLASKAGGLSPDARYELSEGLRLDARLRSLVPDTFLEGLR